MQFCNLDDCVQDRTRGAKDNTLSCVYDLKMETNVPYQPFPFFLNEPGATQQHSLFGYLSSFGPLVIYLDIICKSPADLHDDTSRHGQETCDASPGPLLVMNVAGDATVCFPGRFWLSGEINA